MTERLASPPTIPGRMGGPRSVTAGAATRPVADARRVDGIVATAARIGVLVGASTAVYALTLAGVAALQQADDEAVAAVRAPALGAVERVADANDRLEDAVLRAGAAARTAGDSYGTTAEEVAAYETRLAELAALVGDVQGQAATLPSRIPLPAVTVRGTTAAPRTHATTGASGG